MTRAPPRFPCPGVPHRIFRTPPVPGTKRPASGFAPRCATRAVRSASVKMALARSRNSGISTTAIGGIIAIRHNTTLLAYTCQAYLGAGIWGPGPKDEAIRILDGSSEHKAGSTRLAGKQGDHRHITMLESSWQSFDLVSVERGSSAQASAC